MTKLLTISRRFKFLLLSKPKSVSELALELSKVTAQEYVKAIVEKVQQFQQTMSGTIQHFSFEEWASDVTRIRMFITYRAFKQSVGFFDLVQVCGEDEIFNLKLDTSVLDYVEDFQAKSLSHNELMIKLNEIISHVHVEAGIILTGMMHLHKTLSEENSINAYDLTITGGQHGGLVIRTHILGVARADIAIPSSALI